MHAIVQKRVFCWQSQVVLSMISRVLFRIKQENNTGLGTSGLGKCDRKGSFQKLALSCSCWCPWSFLSRHWRNTWLHSRFTQCDFIPTLFLFLQARNFSGKTKIDAALRQDVYIRPHTFRQSCLLLCSAAIFYSVCSHVHKNLRIELQLSLTQSLAVSGRSREDYPQKYLSL